MARAQKRMVDEALGSLAKVVGVRLDPKLRYLAELGARKQRRSLNSFIDWAVEQGLRSCFLNEGSGYNNDHSVSVWDEGTRLWDVDPSERFARLAILYPELLTHEEQVLWKLVQDSGLMMGARVQRGGQIQWDWQALADSVFPKLREHWPQFLAVSEGRAEGKTLPKFKFVRRSEPEAGLTDDIPF